MLYTFENGNKKSSDLVKKSELYGVDNGTRSLGPSALVWSQPRRAGAEPQSTGLLHSIIRILLPPFRKRKDTPKGVFSFSGVDNGIRTHDLQSHNLTR